MKTLPAGFSYFDAATCLEIDTLADFITESWQDAVEIDEPSLFLQAVDAAIRAKRHFSTGKPLEPSNENFPSVYDILKLFNELGICLVGPQKTGLAKHNTCHKVIKSKNQPPVHSRP